jgi:hypothetical protein
LTTVTDAWLADNHHNDHAARACGGKLMCRGDLEMTANHRSPLSSNKHPSSKNPSCAVLTVSPLVHHGRARLHDASYDHDE